MQTANCKIEAEIINFWTEGDGDAVSTATPHISTTPDSEFWKEKDFGGRHFEFRVSASVIAETGVVVNMGVAGAISFVVVISFLSWFQIIFGFPAAILDFWSVTNMAWKRHLVDKSYSGKVAKARPLIPIGLEMAAKSGLGFNLPFTALGLIGYNVTLSRPKPSITT